MSTLQGGGNIVTNGLVLYLDAANTRSYSGTGSTWSDLSISRYSGLFGPSNNRPTFTSNNFGSMVFDGVDDYIDLNSNNIISGTNPFTFDCFYKVTNTTVNAEIFGNYGGPSNLVNTIWFSGRYGVYLNAQTPYFQGYPLGLGTYHMVVTRSSNTFTLYKNGKIDGTSTNTSSISVGQNFRIGSNVGGIAEVFGGEIYTVKVYNRALSASEVFQNYNATKSRFGL
jgi:hypothetical protein